MPTRSKDADDGEGDEDLRTVRRERDQYREQVLAMTKFLHDYGRSDLL